MRVKNWQDSNLAKFAQRSPASRYFRPSSMCEDRTTAVRPLMVQLFRLFKTMKSVVWLHRSPPCGVTSSSTSAKPVTNKIKSINQNHRVADAQSVCVGATCESGGRGTKLSFILSTREGHDLTSSSSDGAGRPVSCLVSQSERRQCKRCRCQASRRWERIFRTGKK